MSDEAANPQNETEDVSAAGDAAGRTEEVSMAEQLQAVQAERDQYKEKWTRALADLDNYRRRVQREMDEDRKYAAMPLLKLLMPVIDNLDRALQAAVQTQDAEALIQGVQLISRQLESALSGLGAKQIAAQGQPFDPNLHEAISQVPSADHPPLTVLQDVERGYTLHDRVVRPSKVIVSKGE